MSVMTANEKLTIQALRDHDKVQPKLSASTQANAMKEGSRKGPGSKVSVSSRRSHTSGEQTSSKSDKNGRGTGPRMNFFRFIGLTKAWRNMAKTSHSRLEKAKPQVQYENTYKTEPDEGQTFSPAKVEQMLKETLENRLMKMKYNAEKCRLITTELTADIKSKVKAMEFPRYKIVCNVAITENKRQGLEIASRCVWNHNTDNFATYTFTNTTIIAIASVFGVYFE